MSGEVTRQQLGFPPVVLIISTENSGVVRLAQEIREKYPDVRFEPPGRELSSQTSRGRSSFGSGLGALVEAAERAARGSRRDHPARGSESKRLSKVNEVVSEPCQLEGSVESAPDSTVEVVKETRVDILEKNAAGATQHAGGTLSERLPGHWARA